MSNNIFRLLFDIKREVEGFHHSLHAVIPIRQMVWSMFSLRREETWRKQEGRKGAVLVIYYYPGIEKDMGELIQNEQYNLQAVLQLSIIIGPLKSPLSPLLVQAEVHQ